ncbi:universal stress protein [Thermopolyspora sp. NPDC052614]|uniref:universal stress protein n=1 Tax=Thermopolyspora sp. NPDC052614 TaxID=3155682 RepID=UPI0034356221
MILVGVDGSRAGLEAAGWAAREAALRHVPLRVVHAMPRWALETGDEGPYAGVARWMRESAETVLTGGVDRALREAPGLEVESAPLPGDPRPALIKAAADADLLVVGNHGLGGFVGLLIGSTAHGVAAHAPCDVVVVRGSSVPPRGEVVVGIDGSAANEQVLRFAFAEASLRGVRLRAIHAWRPFEVGGGFAPASDDLAGEQGERRLLGEAITGWSERYPDVKVIEETVRGHPADVLRHAAEGSDLLVVGSRGHGGLTGMLLGSVSQAVLQHATCPVAVVRVREDA